MFSSLRRWLALAIAPELKPAPPIPLVRWWVNGNEAPWLTCTGNTITGVFWP